MNNQAMSTLIKNSRLLDPSSQFDAVTDLYIADGRIVAIGESAATFAADNTLDAKGLITVPGLVDLQVRIPEPGYEHKGTVASETRAAAAGGVTSLCCSPDTLPIIDTPSVATLIQDVARKQGLARVYPVGAITRKLAGSHLSELKALDLAGCVAMTNLRKPYADNRVLLGCLEYAATHDITVFFSSIDTALAQDGCAHNGSYSNRLGLIGIPDTAETVALSRDLLLVEQTGVRAYFGELSCARSVELIAAAKARGSNISAGVSIYHLIETEQAIQDFNSLYHLQPPLRTEADRDALRAGVMDGIIDVISSSHQPHETAAKMAPFAATEPGISGIETLLPLTLKLVEAGVLDLTRVIECLAGEPAKIVGINAGSAGIGNVADLCLFDPQESWQVDRANFFSAGHNSTLLGKTLKGRVKYTFLGGRIVHQA